MKTERIKFFRHEYLEFTTISYKDVCLWKQNLQVGPVFGGGWFMKITMYFSSMLKPNCIG